MSAVKKLRVGPKKSSKNRPQQLLPFSFGSSEVTGTYCTSLCGWFSSNRMISVRETQISTKYPFSVEWVHHSS